MVNQSYFYNLPEEIIIYIFTLSGYKEHREKFLKLLPDIKLKAVNRQLNVVHNKFQNKYRQRFFTMETFSEMLKNHTNDQEHMVLVLNMCCCCTRHQFNRPINIYDWHWRPPSPINNLNPHNCNCSCRHYSRMLCQSIHTSIS